MPEDPIEKNDIRIGNLFSTQEGYVIITGIGTQLDSDPWPHSYEARSRYIAMSRISVSSDILIKLFGPDQSTQSDPHTPIFNCLISGRLYTIALKTSRCLLYLDTNLIVAFEYLHQLQNIYYALGEEELNIDLIR